MSNLSWRMAPLAALAALMLLSVPAFSSGDSTITFSGGAASVLLGFGSGGGNNSTSIDLPAGVDITFATVDVEGRPFDAGSGQGFIDFNNPAGSTAWSGSTQTVPPNQAPANYEQTNSTADQGLLANNDANYLSDSANNAAVYQLFEFNVGGASPTNFTLYWKGMGTTTPNHGFSGSNIQLYIYNATSTTWELFGSYQRPSMITMDLEFWFNATGNSSNYVDNRGYVSMMATVSAATFQTSTMDTDYVSLDYSGSLRIWPENITMDVGNDGSVEWGHPARLQGKTTFSGAQFVSGLQRVVDLAAGPTVQVPLKIHSAKGGALFFSNLSVSHDIKDRAPSFDLTVPDLYMDEDHNATLLELRDHFSDDMGVENLKFTIVYQQDPSKITAKMNPDGHRVDFAAPTKYWFGAEKFRVRATDARGQTAESNNFTVNVRFVNHPPALEPVGGLSAVEGVPFEQTFAASDPDKAFDANESLTFFIDTSLLRLNSSTGKVWFTPQNFDVGAHNFNVTVKDHYGANASMAVSLSVENVNNPPKLVYDVPNNQFTVQEDRPFTFSFNATDPDVDIGLDFVVFSTNSSLFNITPDGMINFTPDDKDIGSYNFRITVMDSGELKDIANFTINILGVDEPPVILPLENLTVNEDSNVRFRINATDPDTNDVLSFSTDSSLMGIDNAGWASFRADDKDIGTHVVTVTVRDRSNHSASTSFTITILPVEEPPVNVTVISPANWTKYKEGTAVVLDGNATDEDGDVLNYTWYSDGTAIGWGKNITVTGLKPGIHSILLKVSDGQKNASSPPVNIEVTAKPAARSGSKGIIPGFETIIAFAGIVAVIAILSGQKRAIS
jgi:hypothetical protein